MSSALICGFGNLGKHLAKLLNQQGYRTYGLRRTPHQSAYAHMIHKDIFELKVSDMPPADYVYYMLRPDSKQISDYKKTYLHGLNHLIHLLKQHHHTPKKIILCSSTEIYGNTLGQVGTESQIITPTEPVEVILHQAENIIKQSPFEHLIVRLAHMYHPKAYPYKEQLEAKKISYNLIMSFFHPRKKFYHKII